MANCDCRIIWNAASQEQIIRCPLHAAAPALLEALKRLVAELSEVQIASVREGCGNTNAAVLTLRVTEARAAIKLARGGESDA